MPGNVAFTMEPPNAKQKEFLLSEKKFVAYGGARGGGKSWAARRKAELLAFNYRGIRILLVRHTYGEVYKNHVLPMLEDLAPFIRAGAVDYSKAENAFRFAGGSRIECGYLESDKDLLRYQGIEYDVIFLDEATQVTEYQYLTLLASLRGANRFPKRVYLTCNPGGVGHAWVKRLFVDKVYRPGEKPEEYEFIRATVYDNPALMEKDPDYVARLEQLPPGKREAWLEGNWDVFEGQYFPEFTVGIHTCPPFIIPQHWRRYFAMDYGLDMFAGYWAAMDEKGDCWIYREVYQSNLLMSEAAELARRKTGAEMLDGCFAPPDMWNRRQEWGFTVAEAFAGQGMYLVKASNDRVTGWLELKEWLKIREDGTPRMRIFESCKNLIGSLPMLIHSQKDPIDVDTEPHEFTHGPDAIRYLLAGRPAPADPPRREEEWEEQDEYRDTLSFLEFGR